ncbi:MAG: 23S rRNA (pseudouridine(1915)-N(3))-methyltransferase RlmH [Deltaproteobacteria bacterium]|nr:23S rRNA (pseudouridine(1915)-N(3))-methyltransferase RlmH [Deltaproteobacteria bacterium]MBW2071716.1 23S rRNA (pseudouridine(1915)-N(3))-methyltransferase RlmH [Deltaproteobacteria bacterium]
MKLRLILVGKVREPYLQEGIASYLQRLNRYLPVTVTVVKAERLTKSNPPERIVDLESRRVAAKVPPWGHLVVLDRRGKQFSSLALARWWSRLEREGCRELCFAVGGALGFSDSLRQRADTVLSLSRMTYTHEMSRLILLEQLYRIHTILRGEKYHR